MNGKDILKTALGIVAVISGVLIGRDLATRFGAH